MVRNDLAPGLQIAQACHATATFISDHPVLAEYWLTTSNYIVILQIEGEEKLKHLIQIAKQRGIECSFFREPDLDNQITSAGFEPSEASRKLCRDLKLALTE